jgi:hypothetical protein
VCARDLSARIVNNTMVRAGAKTDQVAPQERRDAMLQVYSRLHFRKGKGEVGGLVCATVFVLSECFEPDHGGVGCLPLLSVFSLRNRSIPWSFPERRDRCGTLSGFLPAVVVIWKRENLNRPQSGLLI